MPRRGVDAQKLRTDCSMRQKVPMELRGFQVPPEEKMALPELLFAPIIRSYTLSAEEEGEWRETCRSQIEN